MSHTSLAQLLSLTSAPVAIAFVDAAPAGVPSSPPASQPAAATGAAPPPGEVFYTVADDHKRCPVGAHTHNVPLSPAEKKELMGSSRPWWDSSI